MGGWKMGWSGGVGSQFRYPPEQPVSVMNRKKQPNGPQTTA